MIAFSSSLRGVGGARTGVAPVHLLDVQDVNGNQYWWADRAVVAPPIFLRVVLPGPPIIYNTSQQYSPWVLSVGEFEFHRSQQSDTGSFLLQNLSGDTLSRDFEKIMRGSALEGALFVYRLWQNDAQAAWREIHGTLTVEDIGVDTVALKAVQLNNFAQDDTPLEISSETCQLTWALARCGATGATECMYSYQSCQVIEHIMVVLNDFEKNFGEASANPSLVTINRARKL